MRLLNIRGWIGLFVIMTVMAIAHPAFAQSNNVSADEKELVRQAVLDYVEGIYNVEPERIEKSVHPDLAKRGFFKKKGETVYSSEPMTFQQLVETAKTFNKSGKLPKTAPKDIVIYDVTDQTASVKLTAIWGIDYMHLAKYNGKWMIVNVLWQTLPKPAQ